MPRPLAPPPLLPLVALVAAVACSREERGGAGAPPPPAPLAAPPGACAAGGGTVDDAASAAVLPRTLLAYCVDPHGEVRTFGEQAKLPLDAVQELFNGDMEIYKRHGLRRVSRVRYVEGGGKAAAVTVDLSRFATTEGAFAMYTLRVVGGSDPALEATTRPLAVPGAAALGVGTAYVWRGQHLAELAYTSEEAEAALRASSEPVLTRLAGEIAAKLPGPAELPDAARLLPREDQVPLGVRAVVDDALGVAGVGPGVFGYYRSGAKRHRVAVLLRDDAEQAKDALLSLGKRPGATRLKQLGEGAVHVMLASEDDVKMEWVFAHLGKRVLGVGDEERVVKPGMSADELAAVRLSRDEKVARLRALLEPRAAEGTSGR